MESDTVLYRKPKLMNKKEEKRERERDRESCRQRAREKEKITSSEV